VGGRGDGARCASLFGGSRRTLCENLPATGPELLGFRKQFVSLYGATKRQALKGELLPGREEDTAALADCNQQTKEPGLQTGKPTMPPMGESTMPPAKATIKREADKRISSRQTTAPTVDKMRRRDEVEVIPKQAEAVRKENR
jgi:hypothetical protein